MLIDYYALSNRKLKIKNQSTVKLSFSNVLALEHVWAAALQNFY